MKTLARPALLLSALCFTVLNATAADQPAEEKKPEAKAPHLYEVEFRIQQGEDVLTSPRISVRAGQDAKIEVVRVMDYATSFDPPRIDGRAAVAEQPNGDLVLTPVKNVPNGKLSVVPMFPTDFDSASIGVTIPLLVEKLPDGLIRLTGRMETRDLLKFDSHAVVGEQTGDIYAIDHNGQQQLVAGSGAKMPSYSIHMTPFVVMAKSGKSYEMKLPMAEGEATVTVTVTELNADGTPVKSS